MYEVALIVVGAALGVAGYGTIQKIIARLKRVDLDTAD
jgi:hypothetical protein